MVIWLSSLKRAPPVLAQFDEESKRFKVYCAQIGKDIQVPVKMWFRIPDVPAV